MTDRRATAARFLRGEHESLTNHHTTDVVKASRSHIGSRLERSRQHLAVSIELSTARTLHAAFGAASVHVLNASGRLTQ
jgi:hypothetical protein